MRSMTLQMTAAGAATLGLITKGAQLFSPGHYDRFALAIRDLGATIGEITLPALIKLTEWVRAIADYLNSLSPATKAVISFTAQWVVILGTVAGTMWTVSAAAGALGTALRYLGIDMTAVTAGVGFARTSGGLISTAGKAGIFALGAGMAGSAVGGVAAGGDPRGEKLGRYAGWGAGIGYAFGGIPGAIIGTVAGALTAAITEKLGIDEAGPKRDSTGKAVGDVGTLSSAWEIGSRARQATFALGASDPQERTAKASENIHDFLTQWRSNIMDRLGMGGDIRRGDK